MQRIAGVVVGGLITTGAGFFALGPLGGLICFAVAGMIGLAFWWPPLRDWLGLTPPVLGIVQQTGLVLTDGQAVQGAGALGKMREQLREGCALDAEYRIDGVTGLPPMTQDDPLYEWTMATHRVLLYAGFSDDARTFYGPHGEASATQAFVWEVDAVGRGEYRDRRVQLLEDLLRRADRSVV